MKKRYITMIISMICIIVLTIWIIWGNSALELNIYEIASEDIPVNFDNYRIAHISDLHNTDNKQLLSMLRDAKPDIIAITGDLIDSRRTDIPFALQFAEEAMKIAPCYYVTGNHESRLSNYDVLRSGLEGLGIVVLDDKCTEIQRDHEKITLIGIDDLGFSASYYQKGAIITTEQKLRPLTNDDSYSILLSHRPELFEVYAKNGLNLVLSGHVHGGQFRLPVLGGLYAPSQGIFPKYDAGLFSKDNTTMIVSRGIGNSIFPFRVNNRPEIVLIELNTIQ